MEYISKVSCTCKLCYESIFLQTWTSFSTNLLNIVLGDSLSSDRNTSTTCYMICHIRYICDHDISYITWTFVIQFCDRRAAFRFYTIYLIEMQLYATWTLLTFCSSKLKHTCMCLFLPYETSSMLTALWLSIKRPFDVFRK